MSVAKDELREMIRGVVREVMEERDGLKQALTKLNRDDGEIAKEHATTCPDCYKNIIAEMNQKSDHVCSNCGLPLGDEAFAKQIDHCPNCGSKGAKKVEKPLPRLF